MRGEDRRGIRGPSKPQSGIVSRDRGTLEHALTHRSRANEDVTGGFDNESLEFLGDAVLGFVIAETLSRAVPDRDEGKKSKMKAALVSTQARGPGSARRSALLGRGEEKTGVGRSRASWPTATRRSSRPFTSTAAWRPARGFIAREFEALIDQ